jgi:hypothetical protein
MVMKLEDRMAVKLLALASVQLGKAVNETLCTEPDRRLVKGLLSDVKELLSDFEGQYFQDQQ